MAQINDIPLDCVFAWRFWRVGWLKEPLPRGWTFYEWRWTYPRSLLWIAAGRLAVKVGI